MGRAAALIGTAVPFVLTAASIIALLVACLAGVTDKSLYLFKINTTDFSISTSTISSLLNDRSLPILEPRVDIGSSINDAAGAIQSATSTLGDDASDIVASASAALASATSTSDIASDIEGALDSNNITAADLGLADAYLISLWNYCEVENNSTTNCKKAQFDWATNATKAFKAKVNSVANDLNYDISFNGTIGTSLSTFSVVSKWTEIVFIIAFVGLGLSILMGALNLCCNSGWTCCTMLVAFMAAFLVCAAAALATAMASIVVGVVEGSAKVYGVKGSINTKFLADAWIAAAFAIGAAVFWLFKLCCCGGSGARGGRRHLDKDANEGSAFGRRATYAPLGNSSNPYGGASNEYSNAYGQQTTQAQQTGYGHSDTYGHSDSYGQQGSYGKYETYRHQA